MLNSNIYLFTYLRHRDSVVACATYKREIAGSISGWVELCSEVVLLGKALCPHLLSLSTREE